MKKFLVLLAVLVAMFATSQVASAGPRFGCSGGGFRSTTVRTYGLPSSCYYRPGVPISAWRPSFGYHVYRSYNYTPVYYGSSYIQPAPVIVSAPKVQPNVAIENHRESALEALALAKFCALRHLSEKENQVELILVSRDFHSDTGALKKVKFKVQWTEWTAGKDKAGKDAPTPKHQDTTCKLKFDEYGRFTEFCD